MSTKEKILKEALKLFSEKGYDSVYVGDIAEVVGIKRINDTVIFSNEIINEYW